MSAAVLFVLGYVAMIVVLGIASGHACAAELVIERPKMPSARVTWRARRNMRRNRADLRRALGRRA